MSIQAIPKQHVKGQKKYINTQKQLNILCIGETFSGKTQFLKRLTRTRQVEIFNQRKLSYTIFVKRIRGVPTYFHELSQKYQVYLENQYDGVIFFVDLIQNLMIINKIIKWLELYSGCSGKDVYKIPIKIVVTKTQGHGNIQKWKANLLKQLLRIVRLDQIIIWQNIEEANVKIKQYCGLLQSGQAQGIKRNFRTQWKIFGFQETLKYLFSKFYQNYYYLTNRLQMLISDEEVSSHDQQQSQLQPENQTQVSIQNQGNGSQELINQEYLHNKELRIQRNDVQIAHIQNDNNRQEQQSKNKKKVQSSDNKTEKRQTEKYSSNG